VDRIMLRDCRCDRIGERLSEYLDEELGTLDRARVALHLVGCPRCAAAAAGLAATIRALHRCSGLITLRRVRHRH
jgi:anti-sigma factor RsiW